jgi:hypothetical protein
MGIDRRVVIARIVGFVREHAYYDSSDNSDTADPYRTVALEEARIAAHWPQVVSAQVFSVESCHQDYSSFAPNS